MPEKPRRKTTPAKKAASPRQTMTARRTAVVHRAVTPAAPAAAPPAPATPKAVDVCPRCGTEKFGPEQRIRAEGRRTVRYRVLVCERGHTFARPRTTQG